MKSSSAPAPCPSLPNGRHCRQPKLRNCGCSLCSPPRLIVTRLQQNSCARRSPHFIDNVANSTHCTRGRADWIRRLSLALVCDGARDCLRGECARTVVQQRSRPLLSQSSLVHSGLGGKSPIRRTDGNRQRQGERALFSGHARGRRSLLGLDRRLARRSSSAAPRRLTSRCSSRPPAAHLGLISQHDTHIVTGSYILV